MKVKYKQSVSGESAQGVSEVEVRFQSAERVFPPDESRTLKPVELPNGFIVGPRFGDEGIPTVSLTSVRGTQVELRGFGFTLDEKDKFSISPGDEGGVALHNSDTDRTIFIKPNKENDSRFDGKVVGPGQDGKGEIVDDIISYNVSTNEFGIRK